MILNKTNILACLILIWAITNIAATTSSPADGRVFNLGLMHQEVSYLEKNTNNTTLEAIDRLKKGDIPTFGEWLISSYYGDSINYFKMSMGDTSYEPYSLRILYPNLVGSIASNIISSFGLDEKKFSIYSLTFIMLNYICFFFSVIISFKILRTFNIDELPAFTLSLIPFFQLGYLKMLQSPMVDAPAVLLALTFLFLLRNKNYFVATIISVIMILTKDSLIIFGIVPFILLLIERNYKLFLPIVAMPCVFVGLRLFSDVDPLSMQYGWEISKGDIRLKYLVSHLGSIKGIINWLIGLWYSFGPFLFLLILAKDSPKRESKIIAFILALTALLFIFAQVMLASRVARTLTPISIPVILFTIVIIYDWYNRKQHQ